MPQVTIGNPILNSAFDPPARHFKFDNDGITSETASRPVAPPECGTIAVKVFNHYGDEVLKAYEV